MCIELRYGKNRIRTLPKDFTAYKVVTKVDGAFYFPVFTTHVPIRDNNVAPIKQFYETANKGGKYKPYYHSFRSKAACDKVDGAFPGKYHFLKIRIQRKHVTCMGAYGPETGPLYQTIVSREFTTHFEEYTPSNSSRRASNANRR